MIPLHTQIITSLLVKFKLIIVTKSQFTQSRKIHVFWKNGDLVMTKLLPLFS